MYDERVIRTLPGKEKIQKHIFRKNQRKAQEEKKASLSKKDVRPKN